MVMSLLIKHFLIFYVAIYFGHTAQLVKSQFPNQGLNLGCGRENPES